MTKKTLRIVGVRGFRRAAAGATPQLLVAGAGTISEVAVCAAAQVVADDLLVSIEADETASA
ncbi:MAG: hypothetical protein WBN40_04565 [Pseudomonadales bacterium]